MQTFKLFKSYLYFVFWETARTVFICLNLFSRFVFHEREIFARFEKFCAPRGFLAEKELNRQIAEIKENNKNE